LLMPHACPLMGTPRIRKNSSGCNKKYERGVIFACNGSKEGTYV
jgi:hypothetical protein